ncbi:MAG: hypothetical protein A4S09_09815 [Proteobacteria bacterium SG_bin7]|nr:MAG: hypothetical protein A4S09_09815 [Proteobacteria bacterium SG_bin7]
MISTLFIFLSLIVIFPAWLLAAPTAIVGARLIDGNGKKPRSGITILIENDRIVSVGNKVKVPKNTKIIDARNKFVVPGLVDAHVHVMGDGSYIDNMVSDNPKVREAMERIIRQAPYQLSRYLCAGVTRALDIGAPNVMFKLRDDSRNNPRSPTIYTSGLMVSTLPSIYNITMPHDMPIAYLSRTSEQALNAIESLIPYRPDFIKFQLIAWDDGLDPNMPPDELLKVQKGLIEKYSPAISTGITATHRRGMKALVHAMELATHKAVAKLGADAIMHGVFDLPVDQELINILKQKSVTYVPTISVADRMEQVMNYPPHLDFLPIEKECASVGTLNSFKDVPKGSKNPVPFDLKIARQNLKALSDAGVKIAMGTDSGNFGVLAGASVHKEMLEMVNAGMSPMQVIVSATKNAADLVTDKPDFGTIEAGKKADILVLDADPVKDIGNLAKIKLVIKNGNVFERSEFVNERPSGYESQ